MTSCRQVNGFPVLKANNYDIESGELSVFQRELNRESSRPTRLACLLEVKISLTPALPESGDS
jgi:hypothetical protein